MASRLSEQLLDWSRRFRAGELTAEDIQDHFATLDVNGVPAGLAKAVAGARQELDSIRYGMCDAGQRGEIARIFAELEALIRRAS